MSGPLGWGSIALGLHPSAGEATDVVELLCRQAVAAEQHGFDGVTMSEHHGGFPTYLPVPTTVAGRLLAVTERVWAAPCPTILPLRHRVSVVEELAWLAAAYPGRVGAGFVSGYQRRDYDVFDAGERFPSRNADLAASVGWVASALRGEVEGPLADDPAVAALRGRPVPVVVGTGGPRGVARAALAGAGLLVTSQIDPAAARSVVDLYHDRGGRAPCLLVRRVWIGEPPRSMADQLASYAAADTGGVLPHKPLSEMVVCGDPASAADQLADHCERSGADGLNLRVFAPDASGETLLGQIEAVGTGVLPAVRRRLGWDGTGR